MLILKIECIGDDFYQESRLWRSIANDALPGLGDQTFGMKKLWWVAEITGLNPIYKFERKFLKYKKDYSQANSKGSRGVYAIYFLENGKVYDISTCRNRYFCRIEDDEEIRMTEKEVSEWLNDTLRSTFTMQPESV